MLLISRDPLITDDIHPQKSCPELIEKSDVLYVTPLLKGDSLLNYQEWCTKMRALNKTYGLHGITHNYHEFLEPISKEDFEEAIDIFEGCFGYKPELFRPPYNKISVDNQELVESYGMSVYDTTYILHPYCHCQTSSWMSLLNGIIFCSVKGI